MPFDKIVYGMVRLKGGRYIKILEISPQNFNLKKNKDKNNIIRYFTNWTRTSPFSFQFKIITEKTDITSLMEQLNEKTRTERDPALLESKKDYVNLVAQLSSHEASSRRFFMIIEYEGNTLDNHKKSNNEAQIAEDMNQAVFMIDRTFSQMGNALIKHDDEALFIEEFLYRFICKRSSVTETIRLRKQRLIRDVKMVYSLKNPGDILVKTPDIPLNTIVSPRGLSFNPNYCVVDGICYSFIFLTNDSYPTKVNANWTACLNFGEGVDVDMFFIKTDRNREISELSRSITRKKVNIKTAQEEDKDSLADTLSSGLYIKNRLNAGEELFYGVTMITIWDYSLQTMKTKKGMVMSTLHGNGIKTLPAFVDCDSAYKMALPILDIDRHLFDKFKRNFTSASLASTYPFDETRMFDKDGFVLGLAGNSLAVYNPFNTKRYNNANIGIFGPSGSGKTYFNLMLARRFRLNDVGVMFILPIKGHEYKEGIEAMGGLHLNLSPGSSICLNIMEIHAEADVDAAILAEAEVTSRSKLEQQIDQVQTFIQLLLKDNQLTAPQSSEFETIITKLYERFGITGDNMSLYDSEGKIKKMPILQDLYDDCMNVPTLADVTAVLKPFIEGNCTNMNGQTNLSLDNKMIAFDVSFVGERYLPAFMYIALVYCYDKIKENLYDLYALFLDEGWKFMINERAEKYVNELIKIVRGYGGSTIFSTQNMKDVMNGKYGESIVDNCATKFLLKSGEKESPIFQSTFNLSAEETKALETQPKGNILMLTNGEKIPLITKTSKKEHALYTTDPNERRALRRKSAASQ